APAGPLRLCGRPRASRALSKKPGSPASSRRITIKSFAWIPHVRCAERLPASARLPLTKIIATIGPATADPSVAAKLIDAGVSVFRLNFGHGDDAEHEACLAATRAAADRAGRSIAIMGDLQGPKIRLGTIGGGTLEFAPGDVVVLQRAPVDG